jgi:alkyl sulfatase BDS1-like metallo-beta-lactamase superfamily hydrolase
LQNSALTWLPDVQSETADATVILSRATLNTTLTGESTIPAALGNGAIQVQGNPQKLFEFLQLIEEPQNNFPIVEPL